MKKLSIAEALREGIRQEMARDKRVFCIGEDIAIPGGWGGAFTVTLGLEKDFADRMLNTPIAENGFMGVACGAALMGMRPIADVQYSDFLFCAMDQVCSNVAKMRYMSGGKVTVPMVIRAPVGVTGRGSQHAQNMETFFMPLQGVKIACPATAYDALGLLRTAVRCDDPVMIFEHKLLYGSKGARAESGAIDAASEIPDEDYTIPLGKAVVRREGADVTIIATLLMMHRALQAADKLDKDGVSSEVIDPRSLVPYDWETVSASIGKTGRVITVEESPKRSGIGAEAVATIAENYADLLKAPPVRVAAPNTVVPFSPPMEKFYIPQVEDIVQAVRKVVSCRRTSQHRGHVDGCAKR